jgi:septum formation protein
MPTAPPELILASTSESRKQILDTLGLRYRIEVPEFDETFPPGVSPSDLAETLALGKARSVARRFEEALVLGADQILSLDGEILRKPENAVQAREQLARLNGKSHTLMTGIALLCEKSHALRVSHEVTRLTLRHLDAHELDAYIATGEWKGCVGSYRIEGQGMKLFTRIEGDVTNARGLPVVRLCTALRDLGVPLFA